MYDLKDFIWENCEEDIGYINDRFGAAVNDLVIDSLSNAFELGVKEGVIGIARVFIRKQLGEEGNTQEKIISNCTEVLGIPEDLVIKAYELENAPEPKVDSKVELVGIFQGQ